MELILFFVIVYMADKYGERFKRLEEENENLRRRLVDLEERFPESDGK